MDNPKNDLYYLNKLKSDLEFIRIHISGKSYNDFADDEILQDSMMFRLIQVSENARKLTDEYKQQRGEIPWADVYGLRNRIVHEYGCVDLSIVYETLINDIPDFLIRIEKT